MMEIRKFEWVNDISWYGWLMILICLLVLTSYCSYQNTCIIHNATVSTRFMEEEVFLKGLQSHNYYINFRLESGELITKSVYHSDYSEAKPGRKLELTLCGSNEKIDWR